MKTFDEIYDELQGAQNNEFKSVLEEAKKEAQKRNKIVLILCLIADAIILKLFSSLGTMGGFYMVTIFQLIMFIVVIDSIIYAIVSSIFSKHKNKYKKMYKEIIIKRIMNNFYTGLEYFQEKEMPKYIYNEGDYKEYYNRYNSEDYFEAMLNDKYGIQMAEVKTKKVETHRDSKGRTRTSTRIIFHGLFAKVVMDKSINSELHIMKNGKMFLDKKQLRMDSSEFEKYFDVSASNQIIGMQLLTADVMEELIDFVNRTNIQYDVNIKNNILYLRFHCGSMFEPDNIKNGALDRESLKKYFYMLNFTYNLSNKLIKVIEETEI